MQLAGKTTIIPYSERLAVVLIDGDFETISRGRLEIGGVGHVIGFGNIEAEHSVTWILALQKRDQLVKRERLPEGATFASLELSAWSICVSKTSSAPDPPIRRS